MYIASHSVNLRLHVYMSIIDLQVTADIKHLIGSDREDIRRSSALFILKLKEQ